MKKLTGEKTAWKKAVLPEWDRKAEERQGKKGY
jgi:hypothetical protein